MYQANKDVWDFYKRMKKVKKGKIKFIKNDYNHTIRIIINKKDLGEFTEEELKTKGIL